MIKKGRRFLIIGKEDLLLDVLIKKLTIAEHNVFIARDVNDVFNKPFLKPFDVVVADLDSFDTRSDQILNYLRIFQSKASIITIVPKKDSEERVRKFLGREAEFCFEKPISITMLKTVMETL